MLPTTKYQIFFFLLFIGLVLLDNRNLDVWSTMSFICLNIWLATASIIKTVVIMLALLREDLIKQTKEQ